MTIVDTLLDGFRNTAVSPSALICVLMVSLILGLYTFAVYRISANRAIYNRAFATTLTVLPLFIGTIILCLQANVVITLGTIGALAIIRFRTAIKDPIDMVFLLWAVHIGITCGCQLYLVAALTSLVATVIIIILENISFVRTSYLLVVHCEAETADSVIGLIRNNTRRFRIKNRTYTGKGTDIVAEISVKDPGKMTASLQESPAVERFSIIAYDADDIV